MKKILHIIPSLKQGGAEKVLLNLVNLSNSNYFEHIIVVFNPEIKYKNILEGTKIIKFNLKLGLSFFSEIRKIREYIIKQNPDIIHAWLYKTIVFSAIVFPKRFKLIGGIHHNLQNYKNEKLKTKLIIRTCRFLENHRMINLLQYVSQASLKSHSEFGFKNSRSIVIPNGIDKSRFISNTIKRTEYKGFDGKINESNFVIGNFGRYDTIKGHDLLFKSFTRYYNEINPKARLVLAGDQIDYKNIELVNSLRKYNISDSTILLGEVDFIERVYPLLDVYVLTSKSESFPMVLCEAMMSKIPCISTDVGDARIILNDLGIIISPKEEDLVEAIKKINYNDKFKDKEHLQSLQQTITNQFTSEVANSKYEIMYKSLTNE